jgi:hypothetical protein
LRVSDVLIAGALIAANYWLEPQPDAIPPKILEKAEPAAVSPPVEAPAVIPPVEPPAPQKPRTEESRAPSRRDLENPLAAPSFGQTPKVNPAEPDSPVAADFDRISLMFRDYRTLTGGNPEGTNAEIMKAIMGGNPKGAMLGPPEGLSVNENGELIDRWGAPYFFHQLTRDLMEIRSAGPDGRMWNDDDLTGP